MRSWLVEFTVFMIIVATVGLAYAGPAEEASVTPLREVTLQETTVICKDFQTSLPKVQEDYRREITALYAALRAANVTPSSGPMLIFKAGTDPTNWSVQAAVPVAANVAAPAGYTQRVLPAGKAEAMVYHGDAAHIDQAFAKLHGELETTSANVTGEIREHVLYWPGNDSPNAVILIEAPHAE